MWFSRTGDKTRSSSSDDLATAIRQANAAATQASQRSIKDSRSVVPSIPTNIITEIKQLPSGGKYLSWTGLGFHINFNKVAAFLEMGPTSGTLLVAADMNGTADHLEIIQRLCASGYPENRIHHLKCTAEVLQAFHSSQVAHAADVQQSATEVERKTWDLFETAITLGVSDVHIETRGAYAQVFFRTNNERIEQQNISFETAVTMARYLYASGDSAARSEDWRIEEIFDISISKTINEHSVQIRFHSAPIYPSGNFQLVCRVLLMNEVSKKNLSHLGYTHEQEIAIRESLIGAQGVVLLVGPTNSGKSTTMQALAHTFAMQRQGAKISTAENPVEYIIKNACQMSIPSSGGDGRYADFVRATLRQDADLVVIGEVRDESTVDAMKSAGLAGRKIFATLHVFEALASFQRLKEMGLSESVLYMPGFISAIIYQRLVPTVCPHCALSFEAAFNENHIGQDILERMLRISSLTDLKNKIKIRNHAGCERCRFTGIVGRTVCAEVLKPDTKLFDFLRANSYDLARRYWLSESGLNNGYGVTAMAHGIQKMLEGMIDPYDLENNIGIIKVERSISDVVQSDSGSSIRSTGEVASWLSEIQPLM